MKLVGFDLSLTATGYATWDGAALDFGTLRPERGVIDMSRLNWIRSQIGNLAVDAGLVIMEGISFGSNDSSAQERAGLAYLVRFLLWHRNTPFVLVAPTTLKKWATGKGNAEKNLVLREVFRRFGVEAGNDNESDAAALLFLGRALIGDWECQMEAQREVLETVRKANVGALNRLMVGVGPL